jgi:hydroxysqualene synthase
MIRTDSRIRSAYAHCVALTRSHYENFPVASLFVSASRRDALAAIYAFARTADDFADEPGLQFPTPESRLSSLADWRRQLNECYAGKASDNPIFVALGDAARRFGLTRDYFDRLIRAFELDARKIQYEDFASLLNYCVCSANPVGRLVLELHDHREPALLALSDSLCTALQLANFWQDAGIDLDRKRVYVPLDDLKRAGLTVQDLVLIRNDDDNEKAERFRSLMELEVQRTGDLFERAKLLPEQVSLGLRLQLRMTWHGGMTVLRKIQRMNYRVLGSRPTLGKWDALLILVKALRQGSADSFAVQARRSL